jgi:hypothetical protein
VNDYQRHAVIPKMQTDRPTDDMDIVAEVNLRLRRNGALSVEGHIGDRDFVLAMLDNARDAVMRQIPATGTLVVPGRDVAVPEFAP